MSDSSDRDMKRADVVNGEGDREDLDRQANAPTAERRTADAQIAPPEQDPEVIRGELSVLDRRRRRGREPWNEARELPPPSVKSWKRTD